MSTVHIPFCIINEINLKALSDTLGKTDGGLTNTEIDKYLAISRIEDLPTPPTGFYNSTTKRERIFLTLQAAQVKEKSGNPVLRFIENALHPSNYIQKQDVFYERLQLLNFALSFSGFQIGEDGKFHKIQPTTTLREAAQRASKLKSELERRNIHQDIFKFCRAELLEENYFHAVFEATKSLADKIREKAELTLDGNQLVDAAFGEGAKGYPRLAFNKYDTATLKSEHKGFANMLRGIFGAFRNTLAHEPKIKWTIEEQDAIDMLTLASLLHRKLDSCYFTGMYTA